MRSEEFYSYNREYAIAEQCINNQPQKQNNHNRSEFISFIRLHNHPVSRKYLIKKLVHCSTQQLKQFFQKHNYTKKNILHFKELYVSQEFVKFVKTFDGYEDAICKLYDNHKKFPRVRNFFKQVGIFSKEEPKHHQRITKLYQEIAQKKETEKQLSEEQSVFAKASVFAEASPNMSSDMAKQKSKEQQIFDEWNGDLIYALNNSDNFNDVANVINDISDQVSTIADLYNYYVNYEVETTIEKAIKKLHKTNDVNEFIFYTAITQHLLSDLHAQSFQYATQTKSTFEQSTELFIRGLIAFVKNLNPVTQVTNLAHTGYFLIGGVCHLAHFVSDITLGSVYLSSQDYDARSQKVTSACEAIKLFCKRSKLEQLKDAYDFISNVPAEQWVDLVAHFAADFVFFGGVHRAAAHLRKIDAIGKTKKSLTIFAKRIRHAIDNKLANNPVLVTAEGITIQCKDMAKNVGGAAKEVITCSRELLTTFNKSFVANLEKELELLRFTFRKACLGIECCANKYVKIDFKHIFSMDLRWNKNGVFTNIKGFHHDLGNFIEKGGDILFKSKKMFKDGFYKANLCMKGQNHLITKTFFPSHWTREQVARAVLEALDNFKKSGKIAILESDGKYLVEGIIKNGTKIRMHITQKGKIVSAFPFL